MGAYEIVFNDPEVGPFVAARAGFCHNKEHDTSIGVRRHGVVVAGIVYTNFTGTSVAMHVAAAEDNWIVPDLLWVSFDYPFRQLGCDKVFGYVKASNDLAMQFDLKLGFEVEAVIKDVYPDGDLFILSMRREGCRWLRIKPRRIGRLT